MLSSRFAPLAALLGATVLIPAALLAQSGTSTISGIVKDTTGGTIPGAQVRVVNEDTSVVLDTLTNQDGLYRVGSLVPGSIAWRLSSADSSLSSGVRSRLK